MHDSDQGPMGVVTKLASTSMSIQVSDYLPMALVLHGHACQSHVHRCEELFNKLALTCTLLDESWIGDVGE
jgi:hypothetical protein